MSAGTTAVIMVFSIPLVLIGGFFLIWALKILTGHSTRSFREQSDEEARTIQEIHQGLGRMEKRIEALETIMLDPERGRRGKDE
jgi:phage shock protein B